MPDDTPEPTPAPPPLGITLHLVGPRVGGPSLDDLVTLATRLTGRPPTATRSPRRAKSTPRSRLRPQSTHARHARVERQRARGPPGYLEIWPRAMAQIASPANTTTAQTKSDRMSFVRADVPPRRLTIATPTSAPMAVAPSRMLTVDARDSDTAVF